MKGDAPFSPRGPVLLLDTMWAGAGGPPNHTLLARNAYVEMIKTAQNVADRYELTREEIDAFALRSHHRAATARDSGRLALENHPVEIAGTIPEHGPVLHRCEAHRRGGTGSRRLRGKLLHYVRALRIGDPTEEGVTVGPLAREDLRDAHERQVRESVPWARES
jgi:hypothetical protein